MTLVDLKPGSVGYPGVTHDVEVSARSAARAFQTPVDSVDAVVVAYQSASWIVSCVTELTKVPGLGLVVVVDHGTDGSGVLAESLGSVVLHDPTNPGFGAGQNRGRALTTAPYVLMCNPDAVVVPEAISAGVTAMAAQPDLAALQGVVRERDTDLDQRSHWQSVGALHLWVRITRLGCVVRWRPFRALVARSGLTPRTPVPVDVEAVAAIVLLVRREALEDVGGFDENYFMYWEDLDLSKRLRRAGWRLRVVPEVWAVHAGGASSTDPFDRERQWWRGCLRYAALWYPRSQWALAVMAAGVQWLSMTVLRPSVAHPLWDDLIAEPRKLRRTKQTTARVSEKV